MRFKHLFPPLSNKYHVLRHTESNFNRKNTYAGRIDTKLSNQGILQAKEIKLSFRPDLVFSSPLDRAQHTARLILDNNTIIKIDERLTEKDGGVIQNMSYSEIAKKYPKVWNIWESHDLDYIQKTKFPAGESDADVVKRVENFLEETENMYKKKNILLVTHTGVIHAMRYLFGYKKDEIYLKPIENGHVETFISNHM